jgi:hypothetical protein
MEKTTQRTVLPPPITFELIGLALIFIAYLLAGGQDRLMYGFADLADDAQPRYFRLYVLAILGIVLCSGTIVIRCKEIVERKRGKKEVFFDGVDALIISPLMLLLGVRLLKLNLSVIGGSTQPDIFNTLSWVLFVNALVTGSLGFVSMLMKPQR